MMEAQAAECLSAQYLMYGAGEWDISPASRVTIILLGAAPGGMVEWQMEIVMRDDRQLAVRAVSARAPMTSSLGVGSIERYLFQDTRGKVTQYRHALTGKPVIPKFYFTKYFLPTCLAEVPTSEGFAIGGQFMGHTAALDKVTTRPAPESWVVDFDLALNPDMKVGSWGCAKDDGTGQDEKKEYQYLDFTEADYVEQSAAGANYFNAPGKIRLWVQDRPIYFLCPPQFPEDLYRSNYSGITMFTDEPAVRFNWQGVFPGARHPAQAADALVRRLQSMYGHNLVPYDLQKAVIAQATQGALDLRVDDIPVWETLIEAGFYEMQGGCGGIVHEGRYDLKSYQNDLDNLLGAGAQPDEETMLRMNYALMRGAARAHQKQWGTAIYGQSVPAVRERALTLAYDMGACWFWFWTWDHDHHLPHSEKLRLMSALRDYTQTHPRVAGETAGKMATTAIAVPWGYEVNYGAVWGRGEFAPDKLNRVGVPYRRVASAAVWEGLQCCARREEFDFTIDHPGLDQLGYERILRVDEYGNVKAWPAQTQPRAPALELSLKADEFSPLKAQEVKPASYVLPCVSRHGHPPHIDGKLDDWDGPWVVFPSDQFVAAGTWDGPQDLSARLMFGYDDKNFYVAAEVTDNIQNQTSLDGEIWNGDCLQVALDPDPQLTQPKEGYRYGQHEIGFALPNHGQPVNWHWAGFWQRPPGPLVGAQTVVARDQAAHRAIYEAAVPLTQLAPLIPAVQHYIGACVVLNDDDGHGRKAQFETSPKAMTVKKLPAQFGSLEFLPPPVGYNPSPLESPVMAVLTPDVMVTAKTGSIEYTLRSVSTATAPLPLTLNAALSSLSPLAANFGATVLTFTCEVGSGTRTVEIPLKAAPGRYQLHLNVSDQYGRSLTEDEQVVFAWGNKGRE